MEQLLIHLIGDYLLQPNKMAITKTSNTLVCLLHVFVYTIPFLFLTQSPLALLIIFSSHFLIDRFGLVRFLIFTKNLTMEPKLEWKKCHSTGFPNDLPFWLSSYLMLIIDNTSHLICNFLVLKYL